MSCRRPAPMRGGPGRGLGSKSRLCRVLKRNLANCTRELNAATSALRQKERELHHTRDQLLHREKAPYDTLAAGIAHEIRNPLSFVNSFAALSLERSKELRQALHGQRQHMEPHAFASMVELLEELEENATIIDQHGQRANQVVESMARLARGHREKPRATDINDLVSRYLDLARHGVAEGKTPAGLAISLKLDPNAGRAMAVPHNLGRVIINLAHNAMEALDEKSHHNPSIKPKLWVATEDMGKEVAIRIIDNGKGISPNVLPHIFEPFYSTKNQKKKGNMGLGLYLCRDIIVEEHGGDLRVDSRQGAYTVFTITLPKA